MIKYLNWVDIYFLMTADTVTQLQTPSKVYDNIMTVDKIITVENCINLNTAINIRQHVIVNIIWTKHNIDDKISKLG